MTGLCHTLAEQIKNRLNGFTPDIALILGSGLGHIAECIENPVIVKYADIEGFPQSSVRGHQGQFVAGILSGKKVLCMQGRIHLYEGHAPQIIREIIHAFKLIGITKLFVTNAAGALNPELTPGTIMLIRDHINLSFANPLIGANDDTLGPRFPDMSNAYDKNLRNLALRIADEYNIPIKQGVYLMVSGPNFETAAEVRAFGILGGDAVGMSTVPEVIAANHAGLAVLGFSVITNLGTGLQQQSLSHAETLAAAGKAADKLSQLLLHIFERL